MERIDIYKIRKKSVRFLTYSGLVLLFFGMVMLVIAIVHGFRYEFPGGDWNYVIILIQGILLFFTGQSLLKGAKYFIEWDNEELRYFLPKSKLIETIRLSEIQSIEIKLHEIKIRLPESHKDINLRNISYNELKRIKKKFEELSQTTN